MWKACLITFVGRHLSESWIRIGKGRERRFTSGVSNQGFGVGLRMIAINRHQLVRLSRISRTLAGQRRMLFCCFVCSLEDQGLAKGVEVKETVHLGMFQIPESTGRYERDGKRSGVNAKHDGIRSNHQGLTEIYR